MPKPLEKRVTAAVAITLLFAGIYFYRDRLQALLTQNDVKPLVAENTRALGVKTLVAELTPTYQQTRSLTGIVKARRSGDLSFTRSGKVDRLLVQQGARVATGALLAEMNTDQFTKQKQALESERERETGKLAKLMADSRFRSMESIRVEVAALKAEVKQLRDEFQRESSSEEATDAQANRAERLSNTQRRIDAVDATSRDPQVAEQQAVVEKISGQIAGLDAQIEQHTLRAPYDGIIAHRYVSDGTLVSPTVPIVKIVERDKLEVWVGLPADTVDDLTVGESHAVFVGDQEFKATVFAKAPELDQTTRTRLVVLTLDQPSEQITPGQIARIEVSRRVEEPGFWLPLSSLTRQAKGLWSVYQIVDDETGDQVVSRQYVEVTHLQEENARVRGTLDNGALVIAEGTHRVVPGQKVKSADISENLVANRKIQQGKDADESELDPSP